MWPYHVPLWQVRLWDQRTQHRRGQDHLHVSIKDCAALIYISSLKIDQMTVSDVSEGACLLRQTERESYHLTRQLSAQILSAHCFGFYGPQLNHQCCLQHQTPDSWLGWYLFFLTHSWHFTGLNNTTLKLNYWPWESSYYVWNSRSEVGIGTFKYHLWKPICTVQPDPQTTSCAENKIWIRTACSLTQGTKIKQCCKTVLPVHSLPQRRRSWINLRKKKSHKMSISSKKDKSSVFYLSKHNKVN